MPGLAVGAGHNHLGHGTPRGLPPNLYYSLALADQAGAFGLPTIPARQVQAELGRRAARQLAAPQPQQIHQHVHFLGLKAEEVAGFIARQPQPIAIEEQQ